MSGIRYILFEELELLNLYSIAKTSIHSSQHDDVKVCTLKSVARCETTQRSMVRWRHNSHLFLPSPMKVFDMGLAKEIDDRYKPDKDGLYNLTGMTGSPRYMVSSFTLHSRR